MRLPCLLIATCLLLSTVTALDAQQNPFGDFPFKNFPFKFDGDLPFKAADFSDQFMKQLLGERGDNKQELAAIKISIADERKLGENQFQMYRSYLQSQKIQLISQGRDVTYLRKLVARLRPAMQNNRRYSSVRVYLARSSITDARAFPGGQIIVYRGLLEFVENEAALVGILGHELSHIDRQHQLEQIRNSRLAENKLNDNVINLNKFLNVGQLMMKSFMTPFGSELEKEADLDGARWSFQLGYDPLEMAQVFRRLHERDKNRQVPLPSFLRSHPFHIDRFKAIQDERNRLVKANPQQKLVIGRTNLKQRKPHP
jgi:predicted Zn-dependent protease